MDIAPDTKQREHYHVCSEDHHNTGCSVDTASLPHLGPLEARETVALAGHVVTHRAVVTVAPPLAVHVVGAGGAGVGAHLALANTRCSHSVTIRGQHNSPSSPWGSGRYPSLGDSFPGSDTDTSWCSLLRGFLKIF